MSYAYVPNIVKISLYVPEIMGYVNIYTSISSKPPEQVGGNSGQPTKVV